MPVVQQKSCDSDDKPGKNEPAFQPMNWMFHKVCTNCDTKRSSPCQNCSK